MKRSLLLLVLLLGCPGGEPANDDDATDADDDDDSADDDDVIDDDDAIDDDDSADDDDAIDDDDATPIACGGDVFEPNDADADAVPLPTSAIKLGTCIDDVDWYALDAAAPAELRVVFAHAEGNIDATLFAADGETVLAEGVSEDDDEVLGLPAGEALLRVTLTGDAGEPGSRYELARSDEPCLPDRTEPNNPEPFGMEVARIGSLASCPDGDEALDLFNLPFIIDLTPGVTVVAEVHAPQAEGNLALELRNEPGQLFASVDTSDDAQRLEWIVPEDYDELMRLHVLQTDEAGVLPGNRYDLDVSVDPPPDTQCPLDDFEYNSDDFAGSLVAMSGSPYTGLWVCHDDVDWFKLSASGGATATVTWDPAEGGVDLLLKEIDGAVVDAASNTAGAVTVSGAATNPVEPVLLRVQLDGDEGAFGLPYTLDIIDSGYCLEDRMEPNDSLDDPWPVGLRSYPKRSLCPDNDDVFALLAVAGETLVVETPFDPAQGTLSLTLFDPTGAEVDSGSERVSAPVRASGYYLLQVSLQSDLGAAPGLIYDLNAEAE